MKKIEIAMPEVILNVPLEHLCEFQGDLAYIEQPELDKLKMSIVRKGFFSPFFVWNSNGKWLIIDGHQRKTALISLRGDGYDLPKLFPCVEISAESSDSAREKLLAITSQYKTFNVDSVQRWIEELGDFASDISRLVDTEITMNLDLSIPGIEQEEDSEGKKECVCPECGCRF